MIHAHIDRDDGCRSISVIVVNLNGSWLYGSFRQYIYVYVHMIITETAPALTFIATHPIKKTGNSAYV